MKENFYKNPALIIWRARKNLMPIYLVILWVVLFAASVIGMFYKDFFDLSSLSLESHFSITSTGLTLTLALFVAGKAAFTDDELKILANHLSEDGTKGQALINFMGPYVFTSMLFFLTGLVSLFGPFVKLNFSPTMLLICKIVYLNTLSLGFFSLFNLVITMLNDVYLKAFRK